MPLPGSARIAGIRTGLGINESTLDYADATIVCLALDTRIPNVVTFDEKDFTIYALPGKKKFHLIP